MIAEARAAVKAAGAEAELRIPRTTTEQLSVTHYFAAKGYDPWSASAWTARRRDPVTARYPRTQFVAAQPGGVAGAMED